MESICSYTRVSRPAFLIAITVFAISAFASETALHSFNYAPNGASPQANLIADPAGNLYGTASIGGTYGAGTAFKLTQDSKGRWIETVLLNFGASGDGGNPSSALTMDSAGNLYGTTYAVAFMLSPGANGKWNETILYTFQGNGDAAGPASSLIFDSAGNLFGTTPYGGANDLGTVFELSPNEQASWSENVLYSFTDGLDGASPYGGLTIDKFGNLYGTATLGGDTNCNSFFGGVTGCGAVFQLTKDSGGTWTETTLHSFNEADGVFPYGNLVADSAGNLYGTTYGGPGYSCQEWGCGTVYRLSPNSGNWTLSTIYQFVGGTDGATPVAGLILDAKGNLYGTTEYGGESAACSNANCGIVFELSPTGNSFWTEKVLHRFSFPGGFGLQPVASLLFDQAGNLYGTTQQGGAACSPYFAGCGSVFKLTPTSTGPWSPTELTIFPGVGDGLFSTAGLVADGQGNLYGTTQSGGPTNFGTVFQMSQKKGGGWNEKVLYRFTGGTDGGAPSSELIFDGQGNLYGTGDYGGDPSCQCGVVFRLSPTAKGSWQETALYTFHGGSSDGSYPRTPLTFDADGNLYGTTSSGGGGYCNGAGCGVVFQLSPTSSGLWTEQILHLFVSASDGAEPSGALAIDTDGSIYGTTTYGSQKYFGTVYKLTPSATGTWNEHIVYAFQGTTDGAYPRGVVFGPDGDLYGTTAAGGAAACDCGTVFHLSRVAGRWTENVLYAFDPSTVANDGKNPYAPPIFDSGGNLYGDTYWGGSTDCVYGCGIAFKLAPNSSGFWTETILNLFDSYSGANPEGRLLLDNSGNLFGTTYYGGNTGAGVVFEITPDNNSSTMELSAGSSSHTNIKPPVRRNLPNLRDLPRGPARAKAGQ